MTAFHDAVADVIEGGPVEQALAAEIRTALARRGDILFRVDARFAMATCGIWGVDPDLARLMEDELLGPWGEVVARSLPAMRGDHVRHVAELPDAEPYWRSDSYRRFTAASGAHHAGLFLVRRPTGYYVAATGRQRGREWFVEGEARRLAALYDQVARACDPRVRLAEAEAVAAEGAVLLLDVRMRPVRVWERARAPAPFKVTPTGVAAADPRRRPALERAFGEALRGGSEHERRLVLRDRRGTLHVVSLGPGPAVPFGRTVAVHVQPLARPVWTARSLGEVFGLTPREAAAVLQVLAGVSTPEACDALRIGSETLKTHLRGAFRKTGTDNRARLVSCLLGHPDGHPNG